MIAASAAEHAIQWSSPHACDHALHPSCRLAWQYSESTPKQRELLERATKYRKDSRGLALADYDSRYGGACQGCAASGALS